MTTVGVEQLAGLAVFAELDAADLARLASAARPVAFPAARRLFEEGGTADRFWIVQDGTVALDLHLPDRGTLIVETLGAGEIVGWSWLFPPYRWRFGAVATRPVRALEFDARLVRFILTLDPRLAQELTRRFAEVVVERLQATRMRLLDLYGDVAETR
ncbi:cyclic nucleotide-binding domain-containing protein [Actinomadura keratinilytica]|jgi:CRP-like cAMP-binding protein|uniref:Cyclic nucleotide-binding domain-containing protein n=1 Tax=Actinomadura keratinilytica TaxID=547461 RepID=A0ABP7Z8P6_9ACTN